MRANPRGRRLQTRVSGQGAGGQDFCVGMSKHKLFEPNLTHTLSGTGVSSELLNPHSMTLTSESMHQWPRKARLCSAAGRPPLVHCDRSMQEGELEKKSPSPLAPWQKRYWILSGAISSGRCVSAARIESDMRMQRGSFSTSNRKGVSWRKRMERAVGHSTSRKSRRWRPVTGPVYPLCCVGYSHVRPNCQRHDAALRTCTRAMHIRATPRLRSKQHEQLGMRSALSGPLGPARPACVAQISIDCAHRRMRPQWASVRRVSLHCRRGNGPHCFTAQQPLRHLAAWAWVWRRTITIRLAARDYVLRAQTSSLAADWKAQLDATVAKLQVP